MVKNSPANAGDEGPISESGRSPEGENGDPLQYSCPPWTEEPGRLEPKGSQESQTPLSE